MKHVKDTEVSHGGGLAPEGWHHVEVRSCTEKVSNRGDAYYNAELVDARTGEPVAFDICMIEGRGNGIGINRLAILGGATRDEAGTGWNIVPAKRLVGARAYVHIHHDQYEWNGEQRTQCKVSLKEGDVGYLADDNPPEGWTKPADGEIPF